MDTRLGHSRLRLELSRGVVAECGVTTQPIVEHFNVLKDIQCRLVPCVVLRMIHELALECLEKAFDTDIVPVVAGAAHAGGDAVDGEYLLVPRGGILAAAIRVVQEPLRGVRRCSAIVSASCEDPR